MEFLIRKFMTSGDSYYRNRIPCYYRVSCCGPNDTTAGSGLYLYDGPGLLERVLYPYGWDAGILILWMVLGTAYVTACLMA